MDKEDKRNAIYWIVILLLIIIILIILFFTRFGKIKYDQVSPTGNIDVFDIDIRCNCGEDKECPDIVSPETKEPTTAATDPDNKGGKKKPSVPSYDKDKDKNELGKVFVDDSNGNYIYQQKLRIFENAAYNFTEKIAPGVSNTYHFVVHNSNKFKVRYYVEMYEDTEYFVNLKYRLKRNNEYVIGDDNNWVTAKDLKTEFSKLNAMSSDSYSLDWKWFYDDNKDDADTLAGSNMESAYKLNIRFYFEEVA